MEFIAKYYKLDMNERLTVLEYLTFYLKLFLEIYESY